MTSCVLNRFMSHMLPISVILLLATQTSGCYLFKKKDNDKRRNTFINHSSLKFTRDTPNHHSSTLQFNLGGQGFCELKIWPQEQDMVQALASVPARPCQSVQPGATYLEKFTDLRLDTLYAVEIAAWPNGQTAQSAERYVAYETRADGSEKKLIGVHANLPMQVAKFRSIDTDNLPLAEVYRAAKPLEGCLASRDQTKAITKHYYERPSAQIKSVKLSGQIVAEGAVSSSEGLFPFNGFVPDEPLNIRINHNERDEELSIQSFGRLSTLKVEEPEITDLGVTQKRFIDKKITVGSGDALSISWVTTQTSKQSFVKVAVDENDAEKNGFACFFDASLPVARIPYTPFFNSLKPGLHEVVISFVFQTVALFNSPAIWFLSSHDWRSFRLERI